MEQYFENIAGYAVNNPTKTTFTLLLTLIVLVLASKIKEWLELRNYFKKLGVPGPMPKFLMGNFKELVANGFTSFDIEIFKKYGKTVGYFEGTRPVIVTKDVNFLKSVMVKDFSHFVNRRVFDDILLPPFDKFLTNVKDEEWKNMRSIVTTTFSSGKLKSMSKNMKKLSNNMSKFLEDVANDDKVLDTKHFFGSYTIDIIASCCFGMEVNSVNDPENEFLKQLVKANSTNFKSPKIALLFIAPRLAKFLAKYDLVYFFPMDAVGFLSDVTKQVINKRKSKEERREDFIQHMVEVEGDENEPEGKINQNGENIDNFNNIKLKKSLTFNEILCTAILFLSAGYETTATTLCFIAYNLSMNQDCQDKLIEEIDRVLDKHGGEVSYESVNEMPYLDMIIEETQRMYPAATRVDRICNQDYEFEGIKLKKGQLWVASIFGLHYDEELYPNPEKFDPERFNETNKKTRDNISHIPFGAGPRSCIAMRFAVLEMKILLATILSKFKFEKCDQTQEKIKLDTTSPITRPETSLKLKVVNRF